MKTKARKKITSLLVATALVIAFVAPTVATRAQAAGIETANQAAFKNPVNNGDGTTTYQTVYFGENNGNPIKWRVLESTSGELFLLSEYCLFNNTYHSDSNNYPGSWVDNILGYFATTQNFTDSELSSINKQKVWGDDNKGTDGMIADNTDGRYCYILSAKEANNSVYFPNGKDDRATVAPWWLRSAGLNFDYAAFVVNDGFVNSNGNYVNNLFGIRPALKIHLSSVLFSSSAASGGKPTTVGANLSAAQQTTAEIKLTVKDTNTSNLDLTIADTTARTALQGDTITIPYTGAKTGTGKYVSCVVEDNAGVIQYYAKLGASESGNASINIPATMPVGSYTIRLFNEQCNADNYTDFASDPISIGLTVQAPASITAQPANAAIIEGSNAIFTVTATSSTPITYQWEESSDNGSTWSTMTGETNSTLTLTAVPLASNGKQYHCVVDNVLGTPVTSNAAILTVNYAPASITAQPVNAAIIEDSSASFTVTATGSTPITYKWEESSNNGSTWSTMTGETGDTLTLTAVPLASNGKQYRCVVDNPANTPVTSNAATLTVLVTPTTPTITPTSLTMQEGTTGSFGVYLGTGTDKADSVSIASDNPAVATVDKDSLTANGTVTVTGVAEGNATVTLGWSGGSRDGITDTVAVTVTSKPTIPAKKYTITATAGTGGTVRGGGSYDENTTVTVTATPNAGSSFVSWTENGIVVSTDANYNFAVTADRTLIANFKAGDAPEPKPTPSPSYSGGSSDNYVGSNKADTSPNLKPAVVGRPFTKTEATKLFGAALAAKPEGQKALSFRAQNYTKVEKAVLAELASLAQKNGVTLTVHFDSVVGKAVTYRLSVNPALVQTDLDLTAKLAGGKLTLPKFPVPVEIAVQMPAGVTMETLKITENGKDITATAKPWLDKNGYLHFTTTGGEIVLGK